MSMETCTEHDDAVVVYDSHGYRTTQCPLCEALANVQKLEDNAETAEETIDSLKDDIGELKSELAAANTACEEAESALALAQEEQGS